MLKNEEDEEEFHENNKQDQQDNSEKLSVSSEDIKSKEDTNKSELQAESTNEHKFLQVNLKLESSVR